MADTISTKIRGAPITAHTRGNDPHLHSMTVSNRATGADAAAAA